MDQKLAGKTALVTGASSGQGAAEASLFAQAGARVILSDIADEAGEAQAQAIRDGGGEAQYRHLDVASEDEWANVIDGIATDFGALNILVNNAGVPLRGGSVTNTKLEDWNRLLSINLTGPFLGIRTAAPLIRDSGGGAIVNTGSIAGLTGHFATAYSTSKWGIRGITKSAAMELVDWNIRVNAVHPGLVHTPLVEESVDFVQALADQTPMERGASSEEIAKVVLFLACDDSGYITGHDIAVDGGFTDIGGYWRVLKQVMAQPDQNI
ncbi:MAG: glucose 1-dehydrogenase [Rhodospirillaceae bacterium]|jgi:NAD(P)-dependent dehydrogenase (short-subunit alcohol dehydrogenase family)|nr:glucose 1-dehydrogenase [Rhodospirillaceae bacterium]MBT5945677.1 glucose 1-dehydrogenase [Rhodospirillaceae bacterium]MBT6404351.1 glucose 1-dehydrogenase [Rhodospirillaceae bacterium]MBT6537128.1 glucose 1-dehydrogenase [Rhodospirillaceae bacterium]MBT7362995.1 glucose 1-dehydrogenase [Rhodospirillaceae bacterium]